MKTKAVAALVALGCLAPGAASAQQYGAGRPPGASIVRRPAPPPPAVRPPAPAPAPHAHDGVRDLFRADSWTYAPRFDRVPHRRSRPHGFFGAPFAVWSFAQVPPEPGLREEPAVQVYARPDAPRSAPEPYRPGTPGPARTLYVVPGCYAGDVAPDPDRLPAGCSAAGVRLVPPRPR